MTAIVKYDAPEFPSVGSFKSAAELLVIEDQDTYDMATDDIRRIVAVRDVWEAERKTRKAEVDVLVKRIQNDFMPIVNGCDGAVSILKRKQKTFLLGQERVRAMAQAEADRKAREAKAAAEKLAAKLAAEGKAEEAVAVKEVAAVSVAPVVAAVATKSAGTSTPKKWKGRVTDFATFMKFVAEHPEFHPFFELQQGALDRAIHAAKGKLTLPGVESYEDFDIRVSR